MLFRVVILSVRFLKNKNSGQDLSMADMATTGKRGVRLGLFMNFGIAAIFTAAALYFVSVVKDHAREQALKEAESKAQLILDRNLAIHTYFSHDLKPEVFKLVDPEKEAGYFAPAWMSSTYAVREIDKHFQALNSEEYYYKECAINARSPQNEADAYERAFIEELNQNPDLKYRSLVRELDGTYYYVTLRRGEVMEEACLRCHSTPEKAPAGLVDIYGPERSFSRGVNEVVSAISIRVPLSAAYENAARFSRDLSKIFIGVLLGLFAVQYLLYRFLIINPVGRLERKTLAISNNEELLGEEISLPASIEFRNLAAAFNTMSRKLRQHMDHLEEKVAERTSELREANEKLQQSLAEIKTLRGVLPICMHCKKIRDDAGSWNQLEKYIAEHSDAEFSHGLCEKCLREHYPDEAE